MTVGIAIGPLAQEKAYHQNRSQHHNVKVPRNLRKAAKAARSRAPKLLVDKALEDQAPLLSEVEDEEPAKKRIKKMSKGRNDNEFAASISESESVSTPPTKSSKKARSFTETDESAEEVAVEIQINIDIYSPAEMQKPFKKRLPAKSGFMIISSFTLVNKDGMVLQFIVPHWVLNPLDLDDREMYKHMLAKSQKSKDPVANVIVELEDGLEEPDTDLGAKEKERRRKEKSPRSHLRMTFSLPIAIINLKIGLQKAKWTCHTNDGSDYCWVSDNAKDHLHLTHAHFSTWDGCLTNNSCDNKTPPNHALFDVRGGRTAPSTALQRCIANNQPAAASAPTINNHFTLPDVLLEIIRPGSTTAAPAPNNHITTQPITEQLMLLLPNLRVGEQLTIGAFCIDYDL
ncbi:hypothetical protein C8J57DRAFT_1227768 [Mycena rebaudengoi]|nr:hypothetical protein C8J57DRAFT_1227768 [Mycena rebaudengoi]